MIRAQNSKLLGFKIASICLLILFSVLPAFQANADTEILLRTSALA